MRVAMLVSLLNLLVPAAGASPSDMSAGVTVGLGGGAVPDIYAGADARVGWRPASFVALDGGLVYSRETWWGAAGPSRQPPDWLMGLDLSARLLPDWRVAPYVGVHLGGRFYRHWEHTESGYVSEDVWYGVAGPELGLRIRVHDRWSVDASVDADVPLGFGAWSMGSGLAAVYAFD